MEIRIKKQPEITIGIHYNLGVIGSWALPFNFNWWCTTGVKGNKNREFSIDILCFRFWVDYWKWPISPAEQPEEQ